MTPELLEYLETLTSVVGGIADHLRYEHRNAMFNKTKEHLKGKLQAIKDSTAPCSVIPRKSINVNTIDVNTGEVLVKTLDPEEVFSPTELLEAVPLITQEELEDQPLELSKPHVDVISVDRSAIVREFLRWFYQNLGSCSIPGRMNAMLEKISISDWDIVLNQWEVISEDGESPEQ
jgi:hypothetical protein